MPKPCKDCKDCVKYNKIERPEFFVTGVDIRQYFQYIIPVNAALTIGGLDTYYDDFNKWRADAGFDYVTEVEIIFSQYSIHYKKV
jgi:hypothetical protein